jgi:putative DNA primase/helicase
MHKLTNKAKPMSLKISRPTPKNFDRPLTTDYATDFSRFLADNSLEPDPKKGLVTDGSIGRAYINVGGARKLVGWYQLWLDQSVPFGRIGDYRVSATEPTAIWKPENQKRFKMTDAHRKEIEELQRQAEVKKAESYNKAAKRAQSLWDQAEPCERHPYLENKQVLSYGGLKVNDAGVLMLPMYDAQMTIVGIQYISPDGSKKFLTGSKKSGSFFILGKEILKSSKVINFAEGYATAASYHQDFSQPVIVAFDAYNLTPVAEVVFEFLNDRKFVFIADNDPESNTGEKEAVKACQAIRKLNGQADVFMPESKGDYNDHKNQVKALEGEVISPTLRNIDVPVDFDFVRGSTGRYLNTKDNVQGVLTVNGIQVVYNVIKKRMEIDVPNTNFIADMKEEAALIEIEDRAINMGIPHTRVRDYLKVLATEWNPVKQWMESRKWDGKSRLQSFLDTIGSPENEKLKEMLMKKWLISCCAAACEDNGVELEGILVFQGAQGLGKTLWFKRLANYEEGWLLEGAMLNPTDKDSVKRAVSHWIVELGEIESTFKKADIDQLKAFITSKSDELRLPYDRASTTYQRRTAFYASVNAREFLTDTSGNRRFWVIPVKRINFNHGIDMQQLWAEVKETLYVPGQKNWFLTPDEREMLNESNEIYRTQSSVEDLILQHVNFDSKSTKPVQMTALLRDLGIANPRMPDFKDASRVLADNGIEPRRSNGKKLYDLDYDTPDEETPVSSGTYKGWDD